MRILTLILLFSYSFSNAQFIQSLGIKGGIAVTNQTWEYQIASVVVDTDKRTGKYFGVNLEFIESKHFSVITEFSYIEKGHHQDVYLTTIDQPELRNKVIFDTKFSYAEFSPLLKVRIEDERFVLYGLLGFRAGYQLSYKSDFYFPLDGNDFNKFLYGIAAGGGIEYKMKQLSIHTEFQYHHDLNTVHQNALVPGGTAVEIKNWGYIICVGVKYYFSQ